MVIVLSMKVITSDASICGWEAYHKGRTANRAWDSHLQARIKISHKVFGTPNGSPNHKTFSTLLERASDS